MECVTSPLDAAVGREELSKVAKLPTMKEIHDAIPPHCKQRSALRSTLHLLRDLVLLAVTAYVTSLVVPRLCGSSVMLQIVAWTTYAVIQGTIATGPWVVGHECGHGAYSESTAVNDTVGFIVHSLLLVPYWSWQYSHAKHHKYTNHLIWGETHVPPTIEEKSLLLQAAHVVGEDAFAIWELIGHLVFGWPAYLFNNATGGRVNYRGEPLSKKGGPVDHFVGSGSQVYPPSFQWKVNASACGCAAVLAMLVAWGMATSWVEPLRWYVGPYLVVNFWLVLYTWLQHTHPDVPHYGSESFTWLRGALSTIDRPYPWIVDELHHHIGTTHVLHHINHKIPHYHAQEATQALKQLLGPLYRYDPVPIWKAAYVAARECSYVSGLEGVQYFRPHLERPSEKNRKTVEAAPELSHTPVMGG